MRKRMAAAFGFAAIVTTLAASRFGGWAVVSVDDVPEYFVAGKPLVLNFVVRQHGERPLGDLKPEITARLGGTTVRGRAWETPTEGMYRASVTVPRTGDWQITIESGFGPFKARLLPLRAIDSTQKAPAAMASIARGRQLFAAKGCVTCHVHRDVSLDPLMKVAPELSDRRFPRDYLAKFLSDPSIKPPTPNMMQMPNPHLKQPEIAALVAFVNSERTVSVR